MYVAWHTHVHAHVYIPQCPALNFNLGGEILVKGKKLTQCYEKGIEMTGLINHNYYC